MITGSTATIVPTLSNLDEGGVTALKWNSEAVSNACREFDKLAEEGAFSTAPGR